MPLLETSGVCRSRIKAQDESINAEKNNPSTPKHQLNHLEVTQSTNGQVVSKRELARLGPDSGSSLMHLTPFISPHDSPSPFNMSLQRRWSSLNCSKRSQSTASRVYRAIRSSSPPTTSRSLLPQFSEQQHFSGSSPDDSLCRVLCSHDLGLLRSRHNQGEAFCCTGCNTGSCAHIQPNDCPVGQASCHSSMSARGICTFLLRFIGM